MASISYDEIFSNFLGSITDYDLQENLSISDSEQLMTEYLHKALASHYLSHIFSSKQLDDNIHLFVYDLENSSGNDSADADYVSAAIAKWMVYEWLHKQVRSVLMTSQMFAGKEETFYSQSQHLSELRALQDDAYTEARRFVMDAGYVSNSYLGGV